MEQHNSPRFVTALARMGASLVVAVLHQSLLAATPSALVVGWGNNMAGQATGAPPLGFAALPGSIAGPPCATGAVTIAGQILTDAVAVSAGMSHGLALRANGTAVGWGGNFFGEATGSSTPYPGMTNGAVTIAGQVLSNLTVVAAGRFHSLGLKGDGTVVAWGANESGQASVPKGLGGVVAIAAGGNHSLALKRDTTVVAWGQRNDPPSGLSNVVAIAVGGEMSAPGLALMKDGTVAEWTPGAGPERTRVVVSNAVAVVAGTGHCLALLRDGTVFGWGFNGTGEATGIPTTTGSYCSSGNVVIGGQPLSDVVAIAAGNGYSLARKSDDTLVAWGRCDNGLHPANVPSGLGNVLAIAAGENFCLAITTNRAPFAIKR